MYKAIRKSTQHRKYPLPDGPWVMTQKWDDLLFMDLPMSREVWGHVKAGLYLEGAIHHREWKIYDAEATIDYRHDSLFTRKLKH